MQKNRAVFFTCIGLYSVGRFVNEGMRTGSLMLGNIRMAQLVTFTRVIVWIIFIAVSYYNGKVKGSVCKD